MNEQPVKKISPLVPSTELKSAQLQAASSNAELDQALNGFVSKVDEVLKTIDNGKLAFDHYMQRFGQLKQQLDLTVQKTDELVDHVKEPLRSITQTDAIQTIRRNPRVSGITFVITGLAVALLMRQGFIPRDAFKKILSLDTEVPPGRSGLISSSDRDSRNLRFNNG